MMRVTVVYNPTAGDGNHASDDLVRLLLGAGYDVVCRSAKDDAYKQALAEPGEFVVAAGGDGTFRKVAARLVGTGVPLAILPLGTANNIASSLGLPDSVQGLAEGLSSARRVRFDVGVASGPWGTKLFFESFGLGLFADVMASLDRAGATAASARFAPALHSLRETLRDYRTHDLAMTLDDEPMSGRYVLFEAMNISLLGPNLLVAPDADPADGALDFVLLTDDRREEFDQYLSYRLERKQDAPCLVVRRARRATIKWDGSAVRFDDKAWPKTKRRKQSKGEVGPDAEIEISLWPAGLDVLVPRHLKLSA
jgi:diacylglycerol kinase family enzyme